MAIIGNTTDSIIRDYNIWIDLEVAQPDRTECSQRLPGIYKWSYVIACECGRIIEHNTYQIKTQEPPCQWIKSQPAVYDVFKRINGKEINEKNYRHKHYVSDGHQEVVNHALNTAEHALPTDGRDGFFEMFLMKWSKPGIRWAGNNVHQDLIWLWRQWDKSCNDHLKFPKLIEVNGLRHQAYRVNKRVTFNDSGLTKHEPIDDIKAAMRQYQSFKNNFGIKDDVHSDLCSLRGITEGDDDMNKCNSNLLSRVIATLARAFIKLGGLIFK